MSFAFFPPPLQDFMKRFFFFYQFTGIKISRVKFYSNYITISLRGCSLSGVEFFETLVKFPKPGDKNREELLWVNRFNVESMQLVFSRSWKLERIVPLLLSTEFFFPVYSTRCSSSHGIHPLSRGHHASSRACNSHAYLRRSLRATFFLLSSSCRLFGRESAKKRTYLSRLLIASGLTREGKTVIII